MGPTVGVALSYNGCAYVRNNPVNRVDPSGQSNEMEMEVIGGGNRGPGGPGWFGQIWDGLVRAWNRVFGADSGKGTEQVTTENLEFSAKQTMQQWDKQIAQRGWTKQSVANVRNNPFTTRSAVNRTTGNPATAYYTNDGAYVVVDDVTGKVIQISNAKNPAAWAPDSSISDPYEPWKK